MSTKQQTEKPGPEDQGGRTPDAALGAHVLSALGRPIGLQRVEVRRLWEGHYRVNVFVGAGAGAARIAHSYFLVADGAGRVTASTPNITRRY